MYHRNLAHLNPYELHKHLINEYILTKPGATQSLQRDSSRDKRDHDVIRENHRFLWDNEAVDSWEKQLSKKYYDKLFKEYCIADLSRYKENKVAMRWRVEKEVVTGKGQFICGDRICEERTNLRSWEVNFGYLEHGEKKNALVKLRLCSKCSDKLNYHSKKREVKRLKKRDRKGKTFNSESIGGGSTANSTTTPSFEETSSAETSTPSIQHEVQELPTSNGSLIIQPENVVENWTKGVDVEEKTREEEFDEYLEELLL
ncbi:hypothetical protein ZHAS_00000165 [Anopheles sinensis]|uniref:Protein FRA10AC1 n=1 Tax=Anopheles sinensis TaxID=74873 RepID=A0A084V9Y7_ANOSI|nr:hypothetical protein ZHAS_00000165 [Anopheles sinensis]